MHTQRVLCEIFRAIWVFSYYVRYYFGAKIPEKVVNARVTGSTIYRTIHAFDFMHKYYRKVRPYLGSILVLL